MRKRKKRILNDVQRGVDFMPGPWKDIEAHESGCRECVSSKNGYLICSVYTQSGGLKYNKKIWRANKRMITQSPEMFDVMMALIALDDESRKAVETGAKAQDVIQTGKKIGQIISKARKIVKEIRG